MKRPTRSMWELKKALPVRSEMLKADVVFVNTNEALTLLQAEAVVQGTGKLKGNKAEVYWHEGVNHVWIAGVTSVKADDDYPSLIHKRSEAEVAEPSPAHSA